MEEMEVEIDKKGIRSALELCAAGAIIVIAAYFIAGQWDAFFVAPPPIAETPTTLGDTGEILPDENAFYINPASTTPIFLGVKELEKKQQALIWEKRDFIAVDEDAGTVAFYDKGAARAVFPITSMPSPGSFFDIPAGFYTVQGKAADHAPKSGRVHLSWAVYLYGNYLIRAASPRAGTAATALARDDAGIGLASEHAKELFASVKEGIPA
ncbi:MAG: L,D-transpeptidase, partial [Candidatus Sungiibacteriota bacterium]